MTTDLTRLTELSGISSSSIKKRVKPIVEVTTSDKIQLQGLLIAPNLEKNNGKKVLIAIHGTASNFYEEDFIGEYTIKLPDIGWDVLTTNNRGHDVLTGWISKPLGADTEKFEDCLKDIDTWIEFAKSKGYKEIVLQGHSLGAEKVVYYMNKGKYAKDISGVILLGPADSFEYQYKFMNDINPKLQDELLKEAEKLVKEKKGRQMLTKYWLSHFGACPQDACSFLDFFKPGSTLSKVLPFKSGNLNMVKNIKVPMLSAIGDIHEFTVIPVKDAMKLLERNNSQCKTYVFHCDHDFTGKEVELTNIVENFLKTLKSE